jgi:hypothetical protein
MLVSVAAAITKTGALPDRVKPHMEDAIGLMALGDFLTIDSMALETISDGNGSTGRTPVVHIDMRQTHESHSD